MIRLFRKYKCVEKQSGKGLFYASNGDIFRGKVLEGRYVEGVLYQKETNTYLKGNFYRSNPGDQFIEYYASSIDPSDYLLDISSDLSNLEEKYRGSMSNDLNYHGDGRLFIEEDEKIII